MLFSYSRKLSKSLQSFRSTTFGKSRNLSGLSVAWLSTGSQPNLPSDLPNTANIDIILPFDSIHSMKSHWIILAILSTKTYHTAPTQTPPHKPPKFHALIEWWQWVCKARLRVCKTPDWEGLQLLNLASRIHHHYYSTKARNFACFSDSIKVWFEEIRTSSIRLGKLTTTTQKQEILIDSQAFLLRLLVDFEDLGDIPPIILGEQKCLRSHFW